MNVFNILQVSLKMYMCNTLALRKSRAKSLLLPLNPAASNWYGDNVLGFFVIITIGVQSLLLRSLFTLFYMYVMKHHHSAAQPNQARTHLTIFMQMIINFEQEHSFSQKCPFSGLLAIVIFTLRWWFLFQLHSSATSLLSFVLQPLGFLKKSMESESDKNDILTHIEWQERLYRTFWKMRFGNYNFLASLFCFSQTSIYFCNRLLCSKLAKKPKKDIIIRFYNYRLHIIITNTIILKSSSPTARQRTTCLVFWTPGICIPTI